MRSFIFMMLASIGLATVYSCSYSNSEIDEIDELMTIQENVVFQDCHTDKCGTGLEKALAYIDSYNTENDVHGKSSIITFVSNIDDCPAEIIQQTERKSNRITQKITTHCRVERSHSDNYIPSPDYLSRHYTRTLVISSRETLSTAIRQYTPHGWSDWTLYTDYHKALSNHAKNIAFFGGSFAHNMRDGRKGVDTFGFDYNGKTTSLMDMVADIFACRHIGNYAQGGQGVHTGMFKTTQTFKFNMYEQIKYAIQQSKENGYEYDIFLLFGGINDCAIGVPLGLMSAPAGDYSYIASFKRSIEYIKRNSPDADIYLITAFPIFNSTEHGKSLQRYVKANLRLAEYYKLPVLDIYNSHIFTLENYAPYYMTDKIHPNGEGYKLISPYIVDFLDR